jgi:hypothetical protein
MTETEKREKIEEMAANRFKNVAKAVLLPNNDLKNIDIDGDGAVDGFLFDLANPFNTAMPLSHIKKLSFILDGSKIDTDKISLIVRDDRVKLTNVPTINEIWWRYGEKISAYVEKSGGLESGEYELECSLDIVPAFYTFYPAGITYPVKKIMSVK